MTSENSLFLNLLLASFEIYSVLLSHDTCGLTERFLRLSYSSLLINNILSSSSISAGSVGLTLLLIYINGLNNFALKEFTIL